MKFNVYFRKQIFSSSLLCGDIQLGYFIRSVRFDWCVQNLLKIFLKTASENITKHIFPNRENERGYWKVMKHIGSLAQFAFKRSGVRIPSSPPRYV